MLDTPSILHLHDRANRLGHALPPTGEAPAGQPSPLLALVARQHQANFDLWHREDEARDPQATDAAIAAVKHAIDALNQQRNDLVEQIDALLFASTQQRPAAALHSETPGLIVDRLSILSLKIFHTEEQLHRADPAHRERNQRRLAVLMEQRDDLAGCLTALWAGVLAGQRRFKLYRQLKMYNDPTLNPVLYNAVLNS